VQDGSSAIGHTLIGAGGGRPLVVGGRGSPSSRRCATAGGQWPGPAGVVSFPTRAGLPHFDAPSPMPKCPPLGESIPGLGRTAAITRAGRQRDGGPLARARRRLGHLPPRSPPGPGRRPARARRDQTYVLVSPYPDLPAPVVASAWGEQLRLDSATSPDLASSSARSSMDRERQSRARRAAVARRRWHDAGHPSRCAAAR
jgi:hypothetical protein